MKSPFVLIVYERNYTYTTRTNCLSLKTTTKEHM